MSRIFLTAQWRNLLMANYAIDPHILKPHLPRHTELDLFNGVHYVSLVGFLFTNVKVRGIAVPFHRSFEEVNLRFYVRYKEAGQWKRGVVFMKEIVPKRAITIIANTLYGEKYATHPMKHTWAFEKDHLNISYQWKVGASWNHISAVAEKEPAPVKQHSAEEFITEHYWGYTFIDAGRTGEYQVAHPQWRIHAVKSYDINCDAESLYGASFAEALRAAPQSVFLAEGSEIQVYTGLHVSKTT